MSLSPDTRRARRRRIARLDETADLFALRDAIVTDPDAETRRAAILRLDASGAARLVTYLLDAASDPSMLVREAAFVALARAKEPRVLALAARACAQDRGFRVRRMALLAAARTCGMEALSVLALASQDPFWRVRVAARRAGAALDAPIEIRGAAEPEPTIAIPEIDDPDPAVMTARLLRIRTEVAPRALVPLLGHSHQALRRIAVAEIAARGDISVLREVLTWLRDERVPYGPAAAEAALARSESRGDALAGLVLESDDEPASALAWALRRAEEAPSWSRLVGLARHSNEAVRRAAVTRLPEQAPDRRALLEEMAARLREDENDDETKIAACTWLVRSGSRDAKAVLSAVDLRRQPSPVRALLVVTHRDALLDDPHGGVRAAAVAALPPGERARFSGDPDPWVRAAALGEPHSPPPETVETLLRLARDPDLGVRRAAMEALEPQIRRVRGALESGALSRSERLAAYTVLRLGGVSFEPEETDPAALAHLALLDDVIAGRVPEIETPAPRARLADSRLRRLGNTELQIQPFGLSGAHGLSYEDFALAREHGVNLFFWEPSHRELTRFLRTKPDAVVVAGTYHADASSIERDVVRTLRALRRDSLDVFLAFWTRSSARLDEVTSVLRALRARGLVRAVGVSTHDRALACDASDRGLDVVMVRHNAAHRGAEDTVFSHCAARGTGVLTFSNLCYGRMLHRSPVAKGVTAPECYRYSLSRPGVHGCIAAPRRHSELVENLAVVDDACLTEARVAELRAHGDHVYARSKAWSRETWTVGDAPRSARETLTDWLEAPESISPEL